MKILSIQFWHNATVAYTENGELKYVLQEEKFDNIKNSSNFPLKAIKYISSKFDITDIDKIVISSLSFPSSLLKIDGWKKHTEYVVKITPYDYFLYFLIKFFPWLMVIMDGLMIKIWKRNNYPKLTILLKDIFWENISDDKIDFIDHHLCHALSPIYFYWLYQKPEPILIFTLDGRGDTNCASIKIWNNWKISDLASSSNNYSLWFLWSSITAGMWMKPLEHEYKVMWLAAYTDEKYFKNLYNKVFKNILWIDGLQWKSKFPTNRSHIYLRDKFYAHRFDNIAWALQYTTEKLVLEWMENAVRHTWIKNIATSGGVFMNVKLNKRIQEADFIDKAYFMPSCWDESNVIGSIFWGYLKNNYDYSQLKPLNSMYYGIAYNNDEVFSFINTIDKEKYDIQFLGNDENSAKVVADMIANFEIVWVTRGAWEWWARSLCNRTILANASDLRSFHIVNDMIKMRDFWMPFAPAILEEYADKYIKNWDKIWKKSRESHQFMISAVDSTPSAQKDLVAAIHQKDKTLRPQLVNESNNKWMFNVLKEFEAKTGTWGMMNTSLNIHGYPLVWSFEQAMFTLENSGMKNLLIWNYLIIKKK